MAEKITYNEYKTLMNRIAYWIISNNKKIKVRDVYNANGKGYSYAYVKKQILADKGKTMLIWGKRFMDCAIIDNSSYSQFPSYVVGTDNTKYYLNTYVDMNKRVYSWIKRNGGATPSYVNVQGTNNNNTTSNTTDATLQKCYDAFGTFHSIDVFLAKIRGRGYSYYYNSVYNTNDTIKRIKNRQGVNCTDSSQLTYRVALALGYTVQFVHVKCKSGGGHIRLRLKAKGSNNWFYRDPASVLNGGEVSSNWCMDGKLITYNPSWVLSDVMA